MEEGLVSQFKLNTTLTTSNLICFDADGVIKKYANPEEILKDFYDVRYQHYHKRKVSVSGTSPLKSWLPISTIGAHDE